MYLSWIDFATSVALFVVIHFVSLSTHLRSCSIFRKYQLMNGDLYILIFATLSVIPAPLP